MQWVEMKGKGKLAAFTCIAVGPPAMIKEGYDRMHPYISGVVELEEIRFLANAGYLVIACGGGGIPVIENEEGELEGVEAVIDKDLASSLLARDLGADLLLVSTGVEKVALRFNTPEQRWLDRLSLDEARRYYAAGEFAEGSMGPKIRAVIEFLEAGGGEGVITNPPNIARALSGATGTHILPH